MTHTTNLIPAARVHEAAAVPARASTLLERGMATVEYAIGVVLVVVIVGAIIFAVQGGSFDTLLKELMEALFDYIGELFSISPKK